MSQQEEKKGLDHQDSNSKDILKKVKEILNKEWSYEIFKSGITHAGNDSDLWGCKGIDE